MTFRTKTVSQLATMICGNEDPGFFEYRSSMFLSRSFEDCDTAYRHDGSTRHLWVEGVVKTILEEPRRDSGSLPDTFVRLVRVLMDPADAHNEGHGRAGALSELNTALSREGYEAFYGDDRQCHLRLLAPNSIGNLQASPHRVFTRAELKRREELTAYLDSASEDEMIENVLLPMFRALGFERITAAGHSDKALEYGNDIWMRYTLPTRHILYFGVQAKRGQLDSSGVTKGANTNVAEIYNQLLMMLGHELFDPEQNKKVLVDHAFLIAGGAITKAARNWLGERLDANKRSELMFMDREDILNLFIACNAELRPDP
jgi:hypothetical protein